MEGGDFSGFAKFNINNEYVSNIDEYTDILDDKGEYQNIDHCSILIIDIKKNYNVSKI